MDIGKTKDCFKKIVKPRAKNLYSCLVITLAILLLGACVFTAKSSLEFLSNKDFSFLTARAASTLSSRHLFAKPAANFIIESPEMVFVQGNSMKGISPPATVTPQVLGSILGGVEATEIKTFRETIVEYIVEQGDTLSSIADKFEISLNTLLWANDLTSRSTIKTGQKLIILPTSGVVHLVKSGDTLGALAKTYKSDLDEIIAFNNLSSEGDIFIGDMVIIPGGKMPARIPQAVSIPLAQSYFIFPTEGKITYGPHGISGKAIDVGNKCGKIVVAAAGGTVQRAGAIRIGGNRVTILHPNGVVTYYGHLSGITVASGQTVTAGQVIGYIGNTGYTLGATGCHLHFEVIGARNFLSQYSVGSNISWSK